MVNQSGSLLPWFLEMVAKQRLHQQSSVQENARFRDGQIVSASAAAAPDAGTSDYDSYPVMALIISDSVADYPNVLLCRSNWGLLIAEQVYPGSRTSNGQRCRICSRPRWIA